MARVWDASIPANLKYVLLALADSANDNGKTWPFITSIARKVGKSVRQVQRDIKELEDLKLVSRFFRTDTSTVYWLNKNPHLLFPPIEMEHAPEDDDPNPFDQPVDNSPQSYPQVVTSMTPGGDIHDTSVVTSMTPRTISEPSMNQLAAIVDKNLLKKQAIEVCKQKRPELNAEAIWEKFTTFFKNKGKEISLEKWDSWITGERGAAPGAASAPAGGALTKEQECANALKAYGIDLYTTKEQRSINDWWAWMDANTSRKGK